MSNQQVAHTIAVTPPMGWNSWNCWGESVTDEKIRKAAKAMVTTGLSDHGWNYINIDVAWQGERGGKYNAIQGNEKFPDMKGLCDYVHSLGLRIGIYSTPFVTSYCGYVGGSADTPEGNIYEPKGAPGGYRLGAYSFHNEDVRQWVDWGIDYLKYDWYPCDVGHVEMMATALKSCGRDIVYSLSNSGVFELAAEYARLANCWRTTGDITDTWESVSTIGFSQDKWRQFAGPGHWNDPDMLVVGQVGWGPELHATGLTPNEQYTHISLWCLLAAPLLLGCDLEQLDDFTMRLLTNNEVLAINQDPLGEQARQVVGGDNQVWAKNMADGSRAVGLFNLSNVAGPVSVGWSQLGIEGKQAIRDLWNQENLGVFTGEFETEVPSHGMVLVRIAPVP